MASPSKTAKSTDELYDLEISRQAKEAYMIFSQKVIEDSALKNAHVSYPIHWALTPSRDETPPPSPRIPQIKLEDLI